MSPSTLAPRPAPRAMLPALLAAITLSAAIAAANPLPEGAVFVHVQPVDPNFCQNPLRNCEDIVQYTEATGILEFDLFLLSLVTGPDDQLSQFQTTLEWTGIGQLLSYEICNGGAGIVHDLGDQVILDLTWPSCPTMTDEVFLIARFIVLAATPGHFGQTDYYNAVAWIGCPPDVRAIHPQQLSATVGTTCAYCTMPCNLEAPCEPINDPTSLTVELRQGQSAEYQIHVPIHGGGLVNPCPVSFITTESWMTARGTELGWNDWLVTLEVDASGLAPGSYGGWMRSESWCVDCTRVDLVVLPPTTGVAEDPGTSTTWGRVKLLYR